MSIFRGSIMKFTDRQVSLLKPKEVRYEVWEDGRKGFGVRVAKGGKKSWIFLYRFNGKNRRMTFGNYPAMTLADAHIKHAEALKDLERGIDPGQVDQDEKERVRQAPTVEDLAEDYLKKWAKRNKRSWAEDERMINKDIIPQLGHMKVKDVRRRDVALMLDRIKEGRNASVSATRTYAVLRKMFNYGMGSSLFTDEIEYNPCIGHVLDKPKSRDRVLSEDEIRVFWSDIDKATMSVEVKRALKLTLITGQRPGEVIGMTWDEIEGEWWTIDGSRVKNGRTHRVYLSSLARELIGIAGEGVVFGSPKEKSKAGGYQHIHVNAMSKAVRLAFRPIKKDHVPVFTMPRFTPHDLRRTAATYIAEIGYTDFMVGKILNHFEKTVTKTYNRYQYDKEKQQALEAWSRKLLAILENRNANNVVVLRKA